MVSDPLGAGDLREGVLRGWLDQPARFREDANAEDDAVRVGYRDRLIVELLQNAADAARTAGRVWIRLQNDELRVANSGVALDPAGLLGLCTLRASAKRGPEGSIGRFGTGFAATLSVTDSPVIVSRSAAIGWSALRTRELVEATPLKAELGRRGGQVPVLRLPFALEAEPPPTGFTTEVRLPLRPGVDAEALLAGVNANLLLLLESLDEVVVEAAGLRRELRADRAADGSVTVDGLRWLRGTSAARLPPALTGAAGPEAVAEAGGELVAASAWWPEGGWPGVVPRVLHAPTPTDEALSLPALIVADVPLEAHRRRTVPGPLRSFALGVAAEAVAALAPQLPGAAVLALVPTGLTAGAVDAELSGLVVQRLRDHWPLPGRRVLDLGRATPAVHDFVNRGAEPEIPALLPANWPAHSAALRVLGVEVLQTVDVVALLTAGGAERDVSWWSQAWRVLADAPDREALAALPVPLLGGGLAPGPRGLLCVRDGTAPDGLEQRLPLRDPEAAHPLQLALGGIEAGPRELLAALRPEIAASYDEGDTELATPVLALAATLRQGECDWLADLALRDSDGEIAPAGELVLPNSPLDRALRDDAPLGVVSADIVAAAGVPALLAAGVGSGLVEVRGDASVADLDGGVEFLTTVGHVADDPVGVRDLEWLRWPAGLELLRHITPAARPYVRWWCAHEPILDGRRPRDVLAVDADVLLGGVYDPAPPGVDRALGAIIGCRRDLPTEPDDVLDLLDRLGDAGRVLGRAQLRSLLRHVAGLEVPRSHVAPASVRAVGSGGELSVVRASLAVLVDSPDLLPLLGNRRVVPVPLACAGALSQWLGVPLASALGGFEVVTETPLTVRDVDGRPTRVDWRVIDGRSFADGPDGLGRARAWSEGRWELRHAYVEEARGRLDALASLERDLE